jgi:hypothetical protein
MNFDLVIATDEQRDKANARGKTGTNIGGRLVMRMARTFASPSQHLSRGSTFLVDAPPRAITSYRPCATTMILAR